MSPDETARLFVDTGHEQIPIEIRRPDLRVLHEGLSDVSHDLEPGDYVITATLPGAERFLSRVSLEPGESRSITLVDEPGQLERIIPPPVAEPVMLDAEPPSAPAKPHAGRIFEKLLRKVRDVSNEPESEARPESVTERDIPESDDAEAMGLADLSLRFLRVNGIAEMIPDPSPTVVADETRDGILTLEIEVPDTETYLMRVTGSLDVPINVLLPATGYERSRRCVAMLETSGQSLHVAAYPKEPRVNLAARYLAGARSGQGALVLMAKEAADLLFGKMVDPMAAVVGGYLLLQLGELEEMHEWADNLANWFPWIPDGTIIAGERAARLGDHEHALRLFAAVSDRGLPVFTDGYSILIERLRRYAGDDSPKRSMKGAEGLLDMALSWAPFVDFRSPTLTITANNPVDPLNPTAWVDEAPGGDDVLLEVVPEGLLAHVPAPATVGA